MGDTPAIAFGLLALALGILLHKKRAKLIRQGGDGVSAGKGGGKHKGLIPRTVLCRVISAFMFLGGVGLASSFFGDWLRTWDFSIASVSSTGIAAIVAVVLGFAVAIDVFDGNGLKPTTYAMIVTFPLLWATGGGSLAWPKALSAWAWSQMTGAM